MSDPIPEDAKKEKYKREMHLAEERYKEEMKRKKSTNEI